MGRLTKEPVNEVLRDIAEQVVETANRTAVDGVLCIVVLVHNKTGGLVVGGNVDDADVATVLQTALDHVHACEHKRPDITKH